MKDQISAVAMSTSTEVQKRKERQFYIVGKENAVCLVEERQLSILTFDF